jgi:hypothetical protein
LKQRGLSRDAVERILIYEVAPVAGANFAHLVWPVIGAWAAFDRDEPCARIEAHLARRARHPRWFDLAQDWRVRRMVRKLGLEKLLRWLSFSADLDGLE